MDDAPETSEDTGHDGPGRTWAQRLAIGLAIVGAFAFLVAEDVLSGWTEHWKAIFGPLIVLFVLMTRGGIDGLLRRLGGRGDD